MFKRSGVAAKHTKVFAKLFFKKREKSEPKYYVLSTFYCLLFSFSALSAEVSAVMSPPMSPSIMPERLYDV